MLSLFSLPGTAKSLSVLFVPLIVDQKGFQTGPDKTVYGLLNLFPVGAVVAEHNLIDSQAAVHLEIEDGLGLLECEKTV